MGVMKIVDIKIGPRHRKRAGDLKALAESIRKQGLLQPIGVTEDNELVFGWRRLTACRDILHWQEIDARTVHVTSIVAGEFAENEMRKNFTVSERVAIMQAIKKNLGNRQGQRTDQLTPNSEQVNRNERTSNAIAALNAGFGGRTTANEAEKITDDGIPELVEAVDRKEIAVYSGAILAAQPTEIQQEIMKMPEMERKDAIKKLRGGRTAKSLRSGHRPSPSKMVTIPYTDVTDKFRPLIKRVKEQSKRHAATVSFSELAIIAHMLANLADSWTESGSERKTHSESAPLH